MSNINTSSSKMTEYICLCGGRTATLFPYKTGAPEKVGEPGTCVRVRTLSCTALSTLQPRGLQPDVLFCPWDFPGKNT